jgi:hypothetical protein
MPDRLERAASGRAKCRSCGEKIEKDALRFGEELPSAYGEGEGASVFWFHPRCAAHRRPEKFLPVAREGGEAVALPDRERLIEEAEQGLAHERLPRIAGAERSASGRAHCRHCKELIPAGAWRLRLSTFGDSGFFDPLGFLHAACAGGYFGVSAVAERVRQASAELDAVALESLVLALAAPAP